MFSAPDTSIILAKFGLSIGDNMNICYIYLYQDDFGSIVLYCPGLDKFYLYASVSGQTFFFSGRVLVTGGGVLVDMSER